MFNLQPFYCQNLKKYILTAFCYYISQYAFDHAMLEKYGSDIGAHPPANTELWVHSMEGRFFRFGAPRDPEFVLTGSLGSCKTNRSYVGSTSKEVCLFLFIFILGLN